MASFATKAHRFSINREKRATSSILLVWDFAFTRNSVHTTIRVRNTSALKVKRSLRPFFSLLFCCSMHQQVAKAIFCLLWKRHVLAYKIRFDALGLKFKAHTHRRRKKSVLWIRCGGHTLYLFSMDLLFKFIPMVLLCTLFSQFKVSSLVVQNCFSVSFAYIFVKLQNKTLRASDERIAAK